MMVTVGVLTTLSFIDDIALNVVSNNEIFYSSPPVAKCVIAQTEFASNCQYVNWEKNVVDK